MRFFWTTLLANAVFSTLALAADIGWEHDCTNVRDWYDTKADPSYQAKIEQAEKDAFKVTQCGADTWGKVAFVVKDIDIDKTPILEAKVNQVDVGSAIKVAVAPLDWSELYVVVARTSADGVHIGDIKTATGWTGKKSFNVVLIVEGKGKSAFFSHFKIESNQQAKLD
ncbi:MAG: hypothetical protein JO317_06820 [Verrucomicrobiae bacterium]|nr:hypothetical protein [Verrucomicrobiae bacterium]